MIRSRIGVREVRRCGGRARLHLRRSRPVSDVNLESLTYGGRRMAYTGVMV